MLVRCLLLLWLTCLPLAGLHAQEAYQLLETGTFSLYNRYVLKNVSDRTVGDVRVKVFVGTNTAGKSTDPPSLNDSLHQRKVYYRLRPKPAVMKTDVLGNAYAEFAIGRIASGATIEIVVEKVVRNSGISIAADALQGDGTLDDFLAQQGNAQYLKAAPHIESDNAAIVQAAVPFAEKADLSVGQRARDIFAWLTTSVTYDEDPRYAHRGALSALETQRGVCTEFSALFVAVCRALGIPARVVNGYWVRNRELPVSVAVDVANDRHAWPEFFQPGLGWVPLEPSLIYRRNGQRAPNMKYFAAIPTTDRHFIWGYGLEEESRSGMSFSYSIMRRPGEPAIEPLQGHLAEETITRLPDDTVAPN